MATASQRRIVPLAGRFPECGFPPLCATPAWRSLPPKCSKWFRKSLFMCRKPSYPLTNSSSPHADFRTLVLTAATRLRWDSRCVCVLAPTRSDLRRLATANPWTLASVTQRSSGSPRNRAARSSTVCSSGSSERRDGRRHSGGSEEGPPHGAPHTFNKLTTKSNPCLERETPLESSCSYCGLLTIQHY